VKYPLDALAGDPAFRPGDALKVEAKCGDSTLDARVGAVMSDALRSGGFRVEEGGWTLRVSATASDTKTKLDGVPVPEVKGTVELIAPDGTVASKSAHKGVFPRGSDSKYYKTFEGRDGGQFDFGSRSPAEAMREEAWNQFIRSLPDSPWPRAAWKSGDRYVELPMKITIDAKPKAD
jgi:hypothetical protein